MTYLRMFVLAILCMTIWCSGILSGPVTSAAEEPETQKPQDFIGASSTTPVATTEPPLVAESANSCEIVSCGMGIKETCKMTCPADKTPKCSCDCVRNIGPMCMEYKANCRCE